MKNSSCLGMILYVLALVIIGSLVNGWALSTIWNWFMPPVFDLPVLTLWKAMGVAMVFELFTGTNRLSQKTESKGTDALIEASAKVLLSPILSVGLAWVIYQFAF